MCFRGGTIMSYKSEQYLRVEDLIKVGKVFNGDLGNGVFRSKQYPFVLNDGINNIFEKFGAAIKDYFKMNEIAWWGGNLTNHTLSSQVSCLNHLFPIREDKETVLSIVKNICSDIEDIILISTDNFMPAYIQFEAVSKINHLNEKYSTRGSNCTSIDALIHGVHKDGRKILFPIEWKYVEAYNGENKASGDKGIKRKNRYTDLINNSLQLKCNCQDVYYYEPFYQLMRQTLWAEQMVANTDFEAIKADDYIHVHVIPSENNELLNKIYKCSGKNMENTWRSCINDQSKYFVISPRELLKPIDAKNYDSLVKYLNNRYW